MVEIYLIPLRNTGLRNLLNKNNAKTHSSIIKWERYTSWSRSWNPNPKLMWRKIWAVFLLEKILSFAWQVAYTGIVTNS